jgi:hypothetical protein
MSDVLLWAKDETPILERGNVALLRGPTGAAKTLLAIRMLVRLASGMPWIGGIQGQINGRIAFVSLKDSTEHAKRMIFEECDRAGVEPSSLRGKIELFSNLDWREDIGPSGREYGLFIIDDATRDGYHGGSLGAAQKYVRELEEFAMWTLGRPAVVVVQSVVKGTSSLYGFAQACFDVLAPTNEFGCAEWTGEPWRLVVDSELADIAREFEFQIDLKEKI